MLENVKQICKIATSMDHITNPLYEAKGNYQGRYVTWERKGILLFAVATIVTLGLAGLFFLSTAAYKSYKIKNQQPSEVPRPVPPQGLPLVPVQGSPGNPQQPPPIAKKSPPVVKSEDIMKTFLEKTELRLRAHFNDIRGKAKELVKETGNPLFISFYLDTISDSEDAKTITIEHKMTLEKDKDSVEEVNKVISSFMKSPKAADGKSLHACAIVTKYPDLMNGLHKYDISSFQFRLKDGSFNYGEKYECKDASKITVTHTLSSLGFTIKTLQ